MKTPFSVLRSKGVKAGVVFSALALASAANAQVDTTAVVTAIEGNSTAVLAVGAAVLIVLAAIAGISYMRRVVK